MSGVTSRSWRAEARCQKIRDLPRGLDAIHDFGIGFVKRRISLKRKLMKRAKAVVKLDHEFTSMSEAELKAEIKTLKETFMLGREDDKCVHRAFAAVREVCWRLLKMKPYQVQVAGGLAIEGGHIAEMSTGEGKTLTATMPGVLAGWRGKGCHIMTTNSYLAGRDAEEMRPIYEYCSLTVESMKDDMQSGERKAAYMADITYCTNKDVAADFLRDQLALGHGNSGMAELLKGIAGINQKSNETVLRGLECAIVDEADSVLIDDGVTPLLISGESRSAEKEKMYLDAKEMASQFIEGEHYSVSERYREITLQPVGYKLLVKLRKKLGGIWTGDVRSRELINQALTVRHFFIKDKQYIIDDDKIVIVDEATGRLMPDRFWRSGTHQAVEAKEGVKINPDKETFARISFQKFFRFYRKLSGMTGTGKEAVREIWYYYHLNVVPIPTNRKCIRRQSRDRIYLSKESKWRAVVKDIEKVSITERPILIGTGSIKDSQIISDMLTEKQIEHQVLNAIFHAEEAEIVATAGQKGSIMVATNMAGRGTDIKLSDESKELGGLHVIATERFESYRIDRQLYGRSSRQGDPGSAVAIISVDDKLIRSQFALARYPLKIISAPFSFRGRSFIPGISLLYFLAQKRSVLQGRLQRKGVMKSDDWLETTLGFA